MSLRSASFAAGSKYYGVTLQIADNQAIDTALNALLSQIRSVAALERGRMTTVVIPEGTYVMSATNSTITLEPWMRIKTAGNVRIVAINHTVPVFWLRNDVSPQFDQGSESENNNALVIDASNGSLLVEGNLSAGSALLRFGNGDGTWGTAYGGFTTYFTALAAFNGLHGTGMDHGIQFTNNGAFCGRFQNIRLTTCNKNIVTSAAAVGVNAFEQHSFIECFFNNTNTTHIEWNGGAGDGSSSHQFSFIHSSLTFCAGDVLTINTVSTCRFEMTQGRIENFTRIVNAATSSPNSLVSLNNVMIIPTNTIGPSLVPHLRKFFIGTFQLQLLSPKISINGANVWSNVAYNEAGMQFMCDDTVVLQYSQPLVSFSAGSPSTNANMRGWPVAKLSSALNRNPGFEEAALNGWTTGGTAVITRTTTATEFYTGAAGGKIACTAQYGILTSEQVPVRAGKGYYADLICRVDNASVTTTLCITPVVTWYAKDGTTVIRTDTITQNATNQNWYNRRSATAWVRHPGGTGRLEAPSGANFATVAWNFSGGTGITTNATATFYIDNAVFVEM